MFLEINDGSCLNSLQIIVDKKVPGFDDSFKSLVGSSYDIEGILKESPAKGQLIELHATNVRLLGGSDSKFILGGKGRVSKEKLREHLHLRPRSNLIGCVARIRSALAFATHQFFNQLGFLYVHTPLITSSDCEGAGEMFQVTTLMKNNTKDIKVLKDSSIVDYKEDFFGKKTFLTVSGQLDVEN